MKWDGSKVKGGRQGERGWGQTEKRWGKKGAEAQLTWFRSLMIVLANLNAHHWHMKLWSSSSFFSAGIENVGQEVLWTLGAPEQEGDGMYCFSCFTDAHVISHNAKNKLSLANLLAGVNARTCLIELDRRDPGSSLKGSHVWMAGPYWATTAKGASSVQECSCHLDGNLHPASARSYQYPSCIFSCVVPAAMCTGSDHAVICFHLPQVLSSAMLT